MYLRYAYNAVLPVVQDAKMNIFIINTLKFSFRFPFTRTAKVNNNSYRAREMVELSIVYSITQYMYNITRHTSQVKEIANI